VDGIKTNSYTNITAGLNQALGILKRTTAVTAQVVLLTDGHHNCGRGHEAVAADLRKTAVLETNGIGGSPADVDEALLKSISSA
jgi:Mg-chelatase subunit ChlD